MQSFTEWLSHLTQPRSVLNDADLVKTLIIDAGPVGVGKKLLYKKVDLPFPLIDGLLQGWLDLGMINVSRNGNFDVVKWVSALKWITYQTMKLPEHSIRGPRIVIGQRPGSRVGCIGLTGGWICSY